MKGRKMKSRRGEKVYKSISRRSCLAVDLGSCQGLPKKTEAGPSLMSLDSVPLAPVGLRIVAAVRHHHTTS